MILSTSTDRNRKNHTSTVGLTKDHMLQLRCRDSERSVVVDQGGLRWIEIMCIQMHLRPC
jgi:hypothetical protein